MDFITFFKNIEEDLITILNDEGQYICTTDHLKDAEVITDLELEHIYVTTNHWDEDDQCKNKATSSRLIQLVKKKLLANGTDQRLIIETILYSLLNQTKFNEFMSRCKHLLWPQYYDHHGDLKVLRSELFKPKQITIDWKKLYEK